MSTKAKTILARRFKKLRLQRDWSTHDLKRVSGVSQKTIWNIENAAASEGSFTLDTAEQLAHTHGYELWQLLLPVGEDLEPAEFDALVKGLTRLMAYYTQANADSRQFIEQVAEREAQRKSSPT